MHYSNIDRPSAPQIVTVHFERRQAPDEHPDLSHLEQNYADVVDEAEREKYRQQDRERLDAYNRGDWHMRGLFVRACISVPIGGGSFTLFHLDSPGLWGIESDCGADYERETWENEEAQLREMMAAMAPEFAKFAKLAKNPAPARPVRTVASELASRIMARRNCEDSGNAEWFDRHTRTIAAIAKQFLPSGSGFDSGTIVDMETSNARRLVLKTSYHHVDQNGSYDGWTEHTIGVVSTFNGPEITVQGRDRNQIKDYIAEVFSSALAQEVPDQFLADVK